MLRHPLVARPARVPPLPSASMARPSRFEEHRWLGDKRSQRVHDLDAVTDACRLDDLLQAETFVTFGPDTLPEARNRCYRPCRHCAGREPAQST
jgi:hypothetical protein